MSTLALVALLEDALRRQTVERRDYLIVWARGSGRAPYLQFPCPQQTVSGALPTALYGEACSDRFLPQDEKLSKEQMEGLCRLGWNEPGEIDPAWGVGRRTENWWQVFDLGSADRFASIARSVHKVLSVIYGVKDASVVVELSQ